MQEWFLLPVLPVLAYAGACCPRVGVLSVARPREHDLDVLLDQARRIWTRDGLGALTIRSLSSSAGVSNGAIYHAFGSRGRLLVEVWIREADALLAFLRTSRDRVAEAGRSAVDEVVAVALAPARYGVEEPDGARLLLTVSADELAREDADEVQVKRLRQHRDDLTTLMQELAEGVWERRDRAAVQVVKHCVVDLPSVLSLQPQADEALARDVLERAVRGILAGPPPEHGDGS